MNAAISVVIPTVGRQGLRNVIEHLNKGTCIPREILICLAEGCDPPELPYPNARIIHTGLRGQVAQRAIGFRQATCDYVLQLDDDIVVDARCLEHLANDITRLGGGAAVAPRFDAQCASRMELHPGRAALTAGYMLLMHGSLRYRDGLLLRAGVNTSQPRPNDSDHPLPTQWVPGGCLLHRRANLILEAFFPYPGKAYCEDLMHSYLLQARGIDLYVSASAVCRFKYEAPYELDLRDWLAHLKGDFRARSHLVELMSGSRVRMWLYYLLQAVKYAGVTVRRGVKRARGARA